MSDPYLPDGWTQDAIDDEYARQARDGDTLADRWKRLPVCGWCQAPMKPYQFLVERDGARWHERCWVERNRWG